MACSTQTIALETFSVPPPPRVNMNTTEDGDSLDTGMSTQQAASQLHSQDVEQSSNPHTPPPSNCNYEGRSSIPVSPPRLENIKKDREASALYRFLINTPIGNVIGLLGLVLTVGFGLFAGIASYRDMKWTEHADAVQACASLYGVGFYSKFCNDTMTSGVNSTPLSRRWASTEYQSSHHWEFDIIPMYFASIVLCTVAALVIGTIYSRPRTRHFTRCVSHARLDPCEWIPEDE